MTAGTDLTKGSIPAHLLRLGLPLLLANLLQCLYGTVDVIVLDRFVGGAGITAASLGGQLMLLVTALATGLSTGASVLVSQYYGRGDRDRLRACAAAAFTLFGAASAVLTAVMLLFGGALVSALHTPAAAVGQTAAYLRVQSWAIFTVFGYNAVCALLRGVGDAKKPLFIAALAALSNAGLDLLFVGRLGMGAGGAALATGIAQGLSFALALAVLFLPKNSLFRGGSLTRPDGRELVRLLRVGLPSTFQSLAVRLSMTVVLGMVNVFGGVAAAAFGVGVKLDGFAQLPKQALAAAMAAMVGQNRGAGDNGRIRSVIRSGALLNLSFAAVMLLFIQLFAPQLAGLMTKDAAIAAETVRYLRIVSPGYLILALMSSYNALPIGTGFSEYAMLNSILDSLVARLGLCWLFGTALGRGMDGIYAALLVCPLAAMLSGCIYYHAGKWQTRGLSART